MNRLGTLFVFVVVLVGVSVSACGRKEEKKVTDWTDAETVMVIANRSEELELVLTTAGVALKLSEKELAEIEHEFEQERAEGDETGLAADFKSFVLDNVEKMLHHQIMYPLDAITDMHWEDGEIVMEVEGEGFISFEEVSVDGDMALETFREEDALRFIEAFGELKGGG